MPGAGKIRVQIRAFRAPTLPPSPKFSLERKRKKRVARVVFVPLASLRNFLYVSFCRSGATGCCATARCGILRRLARITESGKFSTWRSKVALHAAV